MKNDVQKFYIKQIKTTKKIIEKYSESQEFSPTMLINSLLSLVILPFEKAKKKDGKKIFPGSYKNLEKDIGILPTVFTPIKFCKRENPTFESKTIYSFIRKFRNGIAHQNLNVIVAENHTVRIKINNKFSCSGCKKCKSKACKNKGLNIDGNSVVDFEINVTVKQLQKLAEYIANSYLKSIQ